MAGRGLRLWPFTSRKQAYEAIALDDNEYIGTQDSPAHVKPTRRNRFATLLATTGVLILLAIATTFSGKPDWSQQLAKPATENSETDTSPPLDPPDPPRLCPKRQEWRTLDSSQQQSYIAAVLCLLEQPSTLFSDENHTSYADFPWIHSHVGYFTHNSAPFLPWHRYFLHIYEQTLRNHCGYEGSLVYWDWTLDWEALEKSPVFDPETGFGSDGEVGGEVSVGRTGRCLADGPFAGVVADHYDVKLQPHCLSRGFRDLEGKLGHIDGHEIRPESIEEVLSLGTYEEFVALMESRVHDTIPFGIGGDFETFTAPYDPLFFLHHTQLDRLWWLWQQRDPSARLEAYGGHKQRHSMDMASLSDEIEMKTLAPPVTVAEVMDVQGEFLCYAY